MCDIRTDHSLSYVKEEDVSEGYISRDVSFFISLYLHFQPDGRVYYSEKTDSLDIQINTNNTAVLTGRSLVNAAVFGGGKHTWRLQLRFDLKKVGGEWKLTRAQASTY